jgi:putative nucleotidyltransferase with HDIG domain
MWPFGRKSVRQRRLEVRKAVASGPSWFSRWFHQPGVIVSLLVLLLFAALVVLLAIWPADSLLYREGQYIAQPIRARVDFRILDEPQLLEAQNEAASRERATFRINAPAIEALIARIEKIPSILQQAGSLKDVEPELRKQLDLDPPTEKMEQANTLEARVDALNAQAALAAEADTETADADAKKLRDEARRLQEQAAALQESIQAIRDANQAAYEAWSALAKPEAQTALTENLAELKEALAGLYVVRSEQFTRQIERAASHVKLIGDVPDGHDGPVVPDQVRVVDLIGQDETQELREQTAEAVGTTFDSKIRPSLTHYLASRLTEQPVYIYDAEQTAADIQAAREALAADPPEIAYERYNAGDVLVQPSGQADDEVDAAGLSAAKLELLRREHREYIAARNAADPWRPYLRQGARAAISLLLVIGLAAYVLRYEPHVVAQPHRGVLLAVTLLVMLALNKTTVLFPQINPYFALLPVCMAGAILAIAYDQRFALAIGAMVALLGVFQSYEGVEMLFVLVVGLVVFIYQLHEIRTRSKLLIASTVTGLVVAGVVWALALKNSIPWPFAMRNSLWAAGSVLLTGFIVQGLLPLIEKVYQCTTASTLLEWCDASKPLLRRLAMESPGTYNHSLQLGSMCEAAAECIGARGLLARVGAYYHDIGKINKPRYFTENQDRETENKHDKLSPAMSVLVIVGHVKDGLEMAREYNLPTPLREFIATHHGTQLVRYFYHSATKQHEEGEGPAPEESQFRYPGPKPRAREAAILMLADAAESSVRAMTEPTPTRIRTQVHQRVTERLEDGQLDDCLLTLREVHEIEESLIKSLCGMYHGRIAYPSESEKEKAVDKTDKTDESPKPDKPADETPPQDAADAPAETDQSMADDVSEPSEQITGSN